MGRVGKQLEAKGPNQNRHSDSLKAKLNFLFLMVW
jgi:hypothetical protein